MPCRHIPTPGPWRLTICTDEHGIIDGRSNIKSISNVEVAENVLDSDACLIVKTPELFKLLNTLGPWTTIRSYLNAHMSGPFNREEAEMVLRGKLPLRLARALADVLTALAAIQEGEA
jgi:hypothetical protein